MSKNLAQQEKDPHPSLVQVRNSLEVALVLTRGEAANAANGLSHKQCDDIVAAHGDAGKIKAVLKPPKNVNPKPQRSPVS